MNRRRPREVGTSLRLNWRSPRQLGVNPRVAGDLRAVDSAAGRRYRQALARWKVQHHYAPLCWACDDTAWRETPAGYVRCQLHTTLTPAEVSALLTVGAVM